MGRTRSSSEALGAIFCATSRRLGRSDRGNRGGRGTLRDATWAGSDGFASWSTEVVRTFSSTGIDRRRVVGPESDRPSPPVVSGVLRLLASFLALDRAATGPSSDASVVSGTRALRFGLVCDGLASPSGSETLPVLVVFVSRLSLGGAASWTTAGDLTVSVEGACCPVPAWLS